MFFVRLKKSSTVYIEKQAWQPTTNHSIREKNECCRTKTNLHLVELVEEYLNKIMTVYHDARAHVKRKITNHDLDPFADSTPLTVYAEHSVDEVPEVNADEHQEKDVAEDIDYTELEMDETELSMDDESNNNSGGEEVIRPGELTLKLFEVISVGTLLLSIPNKPMARKYQSPILQKNKVLMVNTGY